VAKDSHGHLWFGTTYKGLNKFNPTTQTFTHYLNDSDGQFVGQITYIIEDSHGDIWFVGIRGLFHLDQKTGTITVLLLPLVAFSRLYYEDRLEPVDAGFSPAIRKYDPQAGSS
jgi:ligand-binding sensor domain-containing protein